MVAAQRATFIAVWSQLCAAFFMGGRDVGGVYEARLMDLAWVMACLGKHVIRRRL
jgi:hypothetical protein